MLAQHAATTEPSRGMLLREDKGRFRRQIHQRPGEPPQEPRIPAGKAPLLRGAARATACLACRLSGAAIARLRFTFGAVPD